MPATHRQISNPFILALIILVGVLVGYLYYLQAGAAEEIPLPSSAQDAGYLKFKDLSFDFSLVTNDRFSALTTYGEYPILPGTTGRFDIFAPF